MKQTTSAWVKPGRFGNLLFVLCFLALGGPLSPDALFTRIRDTRKTARICHIFVLSLLVSRSTLRPNAYFFMANAELPNRPGFAPLHRRPLLLGKV